jgi:para-aminobenzoate synthetase component 2
MGICLGHQTIGYVAGASIIKAIRPVHGKVDSIEHDGKGVFKNILSPISVTRYHSLVIDKKTLPNEYEISSITKDGEIMGIRHKEYPIEGVQFHPEAILTQMGLEMLNNFLIKAKEWNQNVK